MGPLAVLYDVHGNAEALDAVLDDAAREGARTFLLGGDYALFGPRPEAAVKRLWELDAEWIRGNGERWTAEPADAPDDETVQGAIAACREALGDGPVGELAGLPEQTVRGDARFCHGSAVSDVRSFLPQPGEDEEELLAGVSEPRVVFGHTHLPFRRISAHGGIELVNPGSVGMPFDRDPRAAYALIHDDRSVEHRRIAYDHRAVADDLRDRWDGAWTQTVGRRIEQARFDPEG